MQCALLRLTFSSHKRDSILKAARLLFFIVYSRSSLPVNHLAISPTLLARRLAVLLPNDTLWHV